MAISSLVLGIISLVMGFIPIAGIFFLVTAILGIVFGWIYLAKDNEKKNKAEAITGIIVSAIAVFSIIGNFISSIFFGIGFIGAILDELDDEYDYDLEYDYDDYDRFEFEDYLNEKLNNINYTYDENII